MYNLRYYYSTLTFRPVETRPTYLAHDEHLKRDTGVFGENSSTRRKIQETLAKIFKSSGRNHHAGILKIKQCLIKFTVDDICYNFLAIFAVEEQKTRVE